ncbi:glycosyltransferase involved in cell wall biosynthesis [Geodermatophilus bullaregiensis]|uniref:glycosyltransferase n=1 Tax=Geodermatophilus bullaregiensis TaxID=1564160 RepID=UPI00195A23E2|nr:glycosyltransferase [Geodermatophilus bullaregiensis]MBM7807011.1 glycosyltransferase involved in cell wall biosynthesis [Geodermatophilus bullaregiensis]
MSESVEETAPGPSVGRVLLLVDSLNTNGAVRIVVGLARRWAGGGARLAALQRATGAAVPATGADVVQVVPDHRRLRHGFPGALLRLARESRRATVVVGGSEIGPALVLGFLATRLTRRPFVVSVHADLDEALAEWMPPRTHRVVRWVHRHVEGAIAVTPGVVAPLVRNGLPSDRVRVVRNGIDTAAIARAAQEPPELAPSAQPTVVATGRLAPQKGYDLLLRAHARVVRTHPHEVLVLNDGPEAPALRTLAEELGVQDTVRFAGAVRAPLPLVAGADLFCLPSRHEGLPLALLEAVSLGVPVVAADCSPGVREALDGGRIGELVPVEDVDALAAALERHLADPAVLRERAAQGPAHARSYDFDAMAAGWASAILALRDADHAADAEVTRVSRLRRRLTRRRRTAPRR